MKTMIGILSEHSGNPTEWWFEDSDNKFYSIKPPTIRQAATIPLNRKIVLRLEKSSSPFFDYSVGNVEPFFTEISQ